jgi:hypothetical protein
MRTWTGEHAPVGEPKGKPNILDIVVHLGRVRRFGGWGDPEYTVLHHSMLVSLLWETAGYPREHLIYALLHDAHEAYITDIPAPVKAAIRAQANGSDPVREVEAAVDVEIRAMFKPVLPPPSVEMKRKIKVCDYAALVIEAGFFGPPNADASVLQDLPNEFRTEVFALVSTATPRLEQWKAARRTR